MGGLFGAKNSLGETTPAFNALRVQTSTQGMVVPVCFGKPRITGNIIWAGDFVATKHEDSGGKGFGTGFESTSYTYKISFAMGLCEGPIIDIAKMWANKEIFSTLPNSFGHKLGSYPQTPWSYLTTNHPTQALCYPGMAYVYAPNYDMGVSNALPNFSFKVEGLNIVSGLQDANPSDILTHIITNSKTGLGLSVSYLDVTDYAIWCLASNLLLSPAFTERKNAADHIKDILEMTFSTCILHDGTTLKVIPLADTSTAGSSQSWGSQYWPVRFWAQNYWQQFVGSAAHWTANVTPTYDLTDDDFLSGDDRDPVEILRISPADAFNFVQIECLDRSHDYNVHVVHFMDQGSIDSYMLRQEETRRYHHICQVSIARYLAQLIGQRSLYVRNTYKFTLGWKYCLLEPMDIVTLTDSTLGMTQTPVRITRIEENENGDLDIEAEDFPAGIGHAATYGADSSEGYIVDFNADPGNVNTPIIFNAPGILTASGYELWCAISGAGDTWGGCDVYASTDDTTYKFVKRLMGPSRYGALSAQLLSGSDPDTTHTLAVDLTTSKGALTSGTQDDADRKVTLCLVEDELISFQTADLTTTYKYNLTYLRRGCYGTAIATHAAESNFIRLDDSLVKIPFDPTLVGNTIYIKCCSFNIWTGGIQSLADVTAYSFIIGASKSYPPNVAIDEANCNFTGPYPVMKWTLPSSETDIEGYELRYGASWAAGTIIETLSPKTDNFKWVNYPIANGLNVTVWIAARDYSKNYSLTPDSYALSHVAADMSGTTITAKAIRHGKKKDVTVNWKAYTPEPEDIDHYDIFASPEAVCTITDANLMATVGKGTKHKVIKGLISKIKYDWRVRPSDVFGDGTASN